MLRISETETISLLLASKCTQFISTYLLPGVPGIFPEIILLNILE